MPSAACRQPPAAFGEAWVSLELGLSTATPNLSTGFPVIQQRPLSIFLLMKGTGRLVDTTGDFRVALSVAACGFILFGLVAALAELGKAPASAKAATS